MSEDRKLAHLQMIQGVVNRLSQNSFLLKGWTVVLTSGLFALAANGSEILFVYLACLPAAIFWWLDAYFLHQERLFRALYDQARLSDEETVDFAMDTSDVEDEVDSLASAALSKTLLAFYGVVLSTIMVVIVFSLFFGGGS